MITAFASPYCIAVLGLIATIGIAFLMSSVMPHASLALLFLTSVVIIAAYTGPGPSLLASVLGFLALNYFFTSPHYTLEVADDGDVATLVFFLVAAAITGNLAARMRSEMEKRRASLATMSNLYDFSRRLSSALDADEILVALADHLSASLRRSPVVILMEQEGRLPVIVAASGEGPRPADPDLELSWPTIGDEMFYANSWNYVRLPMNQSGKGLVAVYGERLDKEQSRQAKNLCDQASVAIDRTRLVRDLEQTRLISETEQLRSALLSSVSHDLRTPLASIIGSTTSLLEYGDSFRDEDRRALMSTVVEEAQRLDRHIQNLLDMTRLGQGLTLHRDWVDLNDIISSAEDRMRDALKGLTVHHEIEQDLPLLWVHGVLIEQALVNLLDNAIRYSPSDGIITISAHHADDRLTIEVCDEGPGIPELERDRIFDMFYTILDTDRRDQQGTGLGLAICRGMVAAHDGSVAALDGRNGRGTCMRILLPDVKPERMKSA